MTGALASVLGHLGAGLIGLGCGWLLRGAHDRAARLDEARNRADYFGRPSGEM